MNPFDVPPSTPPVPLPPPSAAPGPRRGRTALVAVATAGLLGAGVVGVSALASADDPGFASGAEQALVAPPSSTSVPTDDPVPSGDDPTGDDQSGGDPTGDDQSGEPQVDIEIRIDDGDGEPLIIDLDGGDLRDFQECMGMPVLDGGWFGDGEFDVHIGDMLDEGDFDVRIEDMLDEFEQMFGELPDIAQMLEALPDPGQAGPVFSGADGTVTVLGPDGPAFIDLGDGDGSVTVTRDGATGEITVTTEGTASEQDLGEIFVPRIFDGQRPDGLPNLDEPPKLDRLPNLDRIVPQTDPDQVSECLADLGNGD